MTMVWKRCRAWQPGLSSGTRSRASFHAIGMRRAGLPRLILGSKISHRQIALGRASRAEATYFDKTWWPSEIELTS